MSTIGRRGRKSIKAPDLYNRLPMGLRYVRRQTGRVERSKRVLQAQRRDELHRLLPRIVPPNRQRLALAFPQHKHLSSRGLVPRPGDRPVRRRSRGAVRVERRDELDDVVREVLPSAEGPDVPRVRLFKRSRSTSGGQWWCGRRRGRISDARFRHLKSGLARPLIVTT